MAKLITQKHDLHIFDTTTIIRNVKLAGEKGKRKPSFIQEGVKIAMTKKLKGKDPKPIAVLIDQADILGSTAAYKELKKLLSPINTTQQSSKRRRKSRKTDSGLNVWEDTSVEQEWPHPLILTSNQDYNKKFKDSGLMDMCMQIKLVSEAVDKSDITRRLRSICEAESIVPTGLDKISITSSGDVRKAIMLLEQSCRILALDNGKTVSCMEKTPGSKMILSEVENICNMMGGYDRFQSEGYNNLLKKVLCSKLDLSVPPSYTSRIITSEVRFSRHY